MDKEKNSNNTLKTVAWIVIILCIIVLTAMLATGVLEVKINKSTINNDTTVDETTDNAPTNNNINTIDDTSSNNAVANDKIKINLSINNATITEEGPNARIHVDGTINLSYDNNKYAGVILSGYCLGSDNEKYLMNGPGDGRVLFHNDGNNNLTLTENIPQNIKYPDGTVKAWSDIDWKNVKIKYCKIEKMTAILNEGTENPEIVLNVEKNFN